MLEIFFLIWFGRHLANMAQEKGRTKGWAALGVLFWISGEVAGFVIGDLAGLGTGAYGTALGGAAACAFIAWLIVRSLPPEHQVDHAQVFE